MNIKSEICNNSDSSYESEIGELFKLTFPNGYNFGDSYKRPTRDSSSQTEQTDILEIIELTEALSKITVNYANLHREQNLIRSALQSEFNKRLNDACSQLYSRINHKLEEIERSQKDRVEVVRRAFKTQLSDALSHMRSLYNEKLRKKLTNDRTFMESEESMKYMKKIADLTAKFKKSETKIKELTMQINEYQEFDSQPTLMLATESEVSEKPIIEIEDDNLEDEIMEENISQKNMINELNQKIEDLEKQNNSYEKVIEKLNISIISINDELLSTIRVSEQLKSEKHNMELTLQNYEEQNKKYKSEVETLVELQKIQIPPPKEEIIVKKPITKSVDIQKTFKEFPDLSKEVKNLNDVIRKFQSKESESKNEFDLVKNNLISENRRYIEEIKVLQSINIKLKEEMFNKIELQNNFKTLHSASVAYARNNQAIGILPNQSTGDFKPNNANINSIPNFKNKSQLANNDKELLNKFVEFTI